MSKAPSKSPAVVSMRREQAEQRARGGQDDLNTGLKDTFPASDPVSHTTTSISAGRVDVDEAQRVMEQSSEEIAAGDVEGSPQGQLRDYVADIERRVREQPLTSIAIVAALAYVWGATR
jgi:hypothetical protein